MAKKQTRNRARLATELKARRGTVRPCRLPKTAAKRRSRPATPLVPRDYLTIARTYAQDVLEGRIVACQPVRQAIQRQERDRRRSANDATWPYAWSELHAAAVCQFAESMVHVEGKWATPTITLQPWQVWLLTTLFGWRRRDDA